MNEEIFNRTFNLSLAFLLALKTRDNKFMDSLLHKSIEIECPKNWNNQQNKKNSEINPIELSESVPLGGSTYFMSLINENRIVNMDLISELKSGEVMLYFSKENSVSQNEPGLLFHFIPQRNKIKIIRIVEKGSGDINKGYLKFNIDDFISPVDEDIDFIKDQLKDSLSS